MHEVRISVVTPSYNQGQFIEETIRSVVEQRYPNVEYSVLDGGSTDRTIEILQKYDAQLSFWRSKKDRGQAAAINEGFRRATGDILCWLNSDDLHVGTTLETVAGLLGRCLDEPVVLYGGCETFNDQTHWREVRPAISFSRELLEIGRLPGSAECFLDAARMGGRRSARRDIVLRLRLGMVPPSEQSLPICRGRYVAITLPSPSGS